MTLPTLIAGPILRRVDPTSITIWLAFSKKQKTKAVVWEGDEEATSTAITDITSHKAESADVETLEVASALHIALITVNTAQKKLEEKKVYSYNIYYGEPFEAFNNDLGTTVGLLFPPEGVNAADFVPLGYNPGALPTFVLPSTELEDLHLVHGSCRKIHGAGDDAFQHLDALIKTNRNEPTKRPQQAYLTGDQIYADELPMLVLPFVNSLGSTLFGEKKEELVVKATATTSETIPVDIQHFPPNCREYLINQTAKFTGNGIASHLISYQEYCATYLHYWSIDVWDPALKLLLNQFRASKYDEAVGSFHYYYLVFLITGFEAAKMFDLLFKLKEGETTDAAVKAITELQTFLKAEPTAAITPEQTSLIEKWTTNYKATGAGFPDFDTIVKVMRQVQSLNEAQQITLGRFYKLKSVLNQSKSCCDFLQTLPFARRALANIATYMIFDDHEMTDDWNFSQFWKDRVYTSPAGVQILRNGMMAYTIFQDLGNVPIEYPLELIPSATPGDTDRATKDTNYKNAFKTKGNKIELLKKTLDYGKAISDGNKPTAAVSDTIDTLLLVGEKTPAADAFVTPVRWHYDIDCGKAHTFFLDTRTRREYDEFNGSPGLLSKAALDDQLPERIKDMNYPVVFVISPVPALGMPVMEEFAQPLSGLAQGGFSEDGVGGAPSGAISGALKRDNEAWGFSEKHLEQFLERLALFKKVVLLSGDIHYGYSAYADYWKERKKDNHARIIQLVASSFKNGWDLDFILLKSGFAQRMLSGFDFEFEKHGWKDKELDVTGNMAPRHRMRLRRNPIVLPRHGWFDGTTIAPAEPDWTWLLKMSVDETTYKNTDLPDFKFEIANDLPEESATTIDKDKVKQTILEMANRHNSIFRVGRSRRVIWQPHIGHVCFTKSAADPTKYVLRHEFHYICRTDGFLNADLAPDKAEAATKAGAFTVHAINLDVTDKESIPPKTLNEKLETPTT